MHLEISSTSPVIDRNFGLWLIKYLRKDILRKLGSAKLTSWDKYFNEQFSTIYAKKISSEEIIKMGVQNLICNFASASIIIRISPNVYMPGFDRVKVESLCKLINYGNTTIPPVPIFTDTFNTVADNIEDYVRWYMDERQLWQ